MPLQVATPVTQNPRGVQERNVAVSSKAAAANFTFSFSKLKPHSLNRRVSRDPSLVIIVFLVPKSILTLWVLIILGYKRCHRP
ncbi:unnamed protein product [Sphenostylis stenocarpa]|uniref:Uncharacterized protein n=1 Tax=Sphenostylis stenocarpa TaxID=92480 RepID=A0AA86S6Q2_9FABA|nr:unnamed protein product [Sphenostylis stenocarpa]